VFKNVSGNHEEMGQVQHDINQIVSLLTGELQDEAKKSSALLKMIDGLKMYVFVPS